VSLASNKPVRCVVLSLDASGRCMVPLRPGGPGAERRDCMQFGVAQPSEDTPVVIIAEHDDELVVLTDDGEPKIYSSRDPEVPRVVEAATRAYGPSARAVPVSEFKAGRRCRVSSLTTRVNLRTMIGCCVTTAQPQPGLPVKGDTQPG
jgi:hypothetical protein